MEGSCCMDCAKYVRGGAVRSRGLVRRKEEGGEEGDGMFGRDTLGDVTGMGVSGTLGGV